MTQPKSAIPRAQEILAEGGYCRTYCQLPDGSGVLCMEPGATCRHHSRLAEIRREALLVAEALRKYEDEHGHVRDGWVCLKVALAAAEAALRDHQESDPVTAGVPDA